MREKLGTTISTSQYVKWIIALGFCPASVWIITASRSSIQLAEKPGRTHVRDVSRILLSMDFARFQVSGSSTIILQHLKICDLKIRQETPNTPHKKMIES